MRLPCKQCGRVEPKTCGQQDCPYFASKKRTFKQDFQGSSPNIFVGRHGYPSVRVGILATEEYDDNDDPKGWTQKETPIPDILDKRGSLINSNFVANVKSFDERLLDQAQLVAQGKQPADMEVNLEEKPRFRISYPSGASPHGASAKLKKARLTENVKVPRKVDRIVHDTDVKTSTAMKELHGSVDEYYLQRLLSGGLLGTQAKKKLVPTRWSITATDDTLGKQHLEKIRDYQEVKEVTAHFGGHYGNHYLVIFFPRVWSFELFEFYAGEQDLDKQVWADYEGYGGRTQYAEDTAGGYYAARLPILEHLSEKRRQAAVLCIRFVTDEYTNPLGVWVCREAVRKALSADTLTFAEEELALKYARARCKQFGISYEQRVESQSLLLDSFKQSTLDAF